MKHLLFTRIPKNASVTVISLFEDDTVKILQNSLGREHIHFAWTNTLFDNSKPRSLTKLSKSKRKTEEIVEDQKYWDKFYKFCFVRNPYERAISSWKFGSWKASWDCTFEEYLLKLKDQKDKLSAPFLGDGLIHHSTLQYNYIYNEEGDLKVDYIGKIENFKQDLAEILEINNLPQINWLPHRNRTKHRPYDEYYSLETRDLVDEIYEKDITTFNYNF